MNTEMKFQIGKNGVTEGIIESLKNAFKKHKSVRISVLKSSGRNRESMKTMAHDISEKLGGNYKHIIIGFTIILRKTAEKKSR